MEGTCPQLTASSNPRGVLYCPEVLGKGLRMRTERVSPTVVIRGSGSSLILTLTGSQGLRGQICQRSLPMGGAQESPRGSRCVRGQWWGSKLHKGSVAV